MAVSYTLDQYVNDVRSITAKETDPIKIIDLVAPLAKKFAHRPGGFAPNIATATPSKVSVFTCFTKSLTTIWQFSLFRGCRTGAQRRTITRPGPSLSVWRAKRRRSVTIRSMTALPPAMPTSSVVASKE